jgi:hypothetical protein
VDLLFFFPAAHIKKKKKKKERNPTQKSVFFFSLEEVCWKSLSFLHLELFVALPRVVCLGPWQGDCGPA